MTERTYTHTLDMDQLAQAAREYEEISAAGQAAANKGDDDTALGHAIDALHKAQEMFYMLMPSDVQEEFWDALEEAMEGAR